MSEFRTKYQEKVHKANFIKPEVYKGRINREYQSLPKYSIQYPNKRAYVICSGKTLEQIQLANPDAVVMKM